MTATEEPPTRNGEWWFSSCSCDKHGGLKSGKSGWCLDLTLAGSSSVVWDNAEFGLVSLSGKVGLSRDCLVWVMAQEQFSWLWNGSAMSHPWPRKTPVLLAAGHTIPAVPLQSCLFPALCTWGSDYMACKTETNWYRALYRKGGGGVSYLT